MEKKEYQTISAAGHTSNTSFVSRLIFQWMNIVFKEGSKKPAQENDFLPLSEENTSNFLSQRLQTKWENEKAKCKENGKTPRLWKSVRKMLSIEDIAVLVSTGAVFTVSRFLQPLLLGYLLANLITTKSQRDYLLYGCPLAMVINELIGVLMLHQFSYRAEVLGIRISAALKGLVYRKTLLLSKIALSEFSTGHVIDLVSNDVQRLEDEAAKSFIYAPFALLQLLVLTYLLVYFIGWQTVMGVIFLYLTLPYSAGLSYASAQLRLRIAVLSDRRISLMNQVVSGIRAIKSYAWEDEYQEKVKDIRKQEINMIRWKGAVLSGISTLQYTLAPVAVLLSVITLALTGQPLTPVSVFMLLNIMILLRLSIGNIFIEGLVGAYDAYVSLDRLEDFLLLETLPVVSRDHTGYDRSDTNRDLLSFNRTNLPDYQGENQNSFPNEMGSFHTRTPMSLLVRGLKHHQFKRGDKLSLQDIDFTTATGSMTVITGPVGSGKSTLLSAIAGELPHTGGTIDCKGSLVYLPQTAWAFTGTIRENILFGKQYDEPKYVTIIEACALKQDIQRFPEGDQTIVGERGQTLSGGQRARISLARAIYADADVYLLDDPLSAVDLKVGGHIFKQCIKGLLGHKTRVITSHHEQLMKEADKVIVLYKGCVLAEGDFTELKNEGILNTTVDPLYLELDGNKPDSSIDGENEERGEVSRGDCRIAQETKEGKGIQIEEEDRMIGAVSSQLYWNYFRSGISLFGIVGLFFLSVMTQALLVCCNVWLSHLTKEQPDDQRAPSNLYIYGCLVGAAVVFLIISTYAFLSLSLRCSERLHDKMVVSVLQAPVLFFDLNPVGRILNRFSKDVGCADEVLPKTFLESIQFILLLVASVVVPIATNPWLLFAVVPVVALAVLIARYYLRTSRELKRLQSICRSPVFSHITETIEGLETIRTRGRQRDFLDRFFRYLDVHNQSFILEKASGQWLGVRLDILTSLLIGPVAFASVLVSQDAASAGLALIYIIQTVLLTQFAVKTTSEVENLMTSVERVIAYTKLDSEPGYKEVQHPPENWPREGTISFQDVSLTYYPGGPQVLKGINVNIKGRAKIGIAGRTGAGKSSFVAALLRMPDPDGEIIVDGVRIKKINLREARRHFAVLGQNPVLFSGSLRENLDLMGQFLDADLWRVLEDVQLKVFVESLERQLDHELLEGGANVSVGERQLICLARVLLQQNKIIILDEPTAHVDPATEQTFWNVVRDRLRDSTVITIAHRLNTITDCDKILVFNNGEVKGSDSLVTVTHRK